MTNSTTSSAHTPGPWHFGESENASVYDGEKHYVILSNPETHTGLTIADIETLCVENEQLANARLIAKAWLIPELVLACQDALMSLESPPDNQADTIARLKAVIAKAA